MISYLCFANMLIRQLVGDPNLRGKPSTLTTTANLPAPLKFCDRNAPACTRCGALLLNVFVFIRTSDTNCCSGSASSAVACLRTFPKGQSFAVRLLSRSTQFICNISSMSRPLASSICRASLNEYGRICITK